MWRNFHRINCRHNGLDQEQPLMIDFPPVRDDEVGKKKVGIWDIPRLSQLINGQSMR